MSRDEIVEMARQAGAYSPAVEKDDWAFVLVDLERFATLVATLERIKQEKLAALEQPEPGGVCARCGGWVCDPVIEQQAEPVATVTLNENMGAEFKFNRPHTLLPGEVLYVYTTPQPAAWVGLTDAEVDALALDEDGLPNSHLEFARAIEAKMREKNGRAA